VDSTANGPVSGGPGAGAGPGPGAETGPGAGTDQTTFSSLLEDSAEDLYENAPCGYLSTLLDGQIARINTTLLTWLGYRRDQLVGRRYLSDLLTVGGRIYYETHLAPLVSMQGEVRGVALDLQAADGARLPVLITSVVKTDASGEPILVRTTVFDARDRRAYERELLRARHEAEGERARLQQLVATLQQSLLPPALPVMPGLDAAAHYQIASPDEVGGDFYDLWRISPADWMTTLPFWPLASRLPAGNSVMAATYSPVWSSVSAPGALVLTDSIPLSADCLRSYVSLVAMTCPLVATRLKWYLPPDPFFSTNLPAMLPPR